MVLSEKEDEEELFANVLCRLDDGMANGERSNFPVV